MNTKNLICKHKATVLRISSYNRKMEKNAKEQKIQLRCTHEYKDNYEAYVEKSGVSGAEIVRRALDEFMEKYPNGAIFLQKSVEKDTIKEEMHEISDKLTKILAKLK